jgi:hypothetical protein
MAALAAAPPEKILPQNQRKTDKHLRVQSGLKKTSPPKNDDETMAGYAQYWQPHAAIVKGRMAIGHRKRRR